MATGSQRSGRRRRILTRCLFVTAGPLYTIEWRTNTISLADGDAEPDNPLFAGMPPPLCAAAYAAPSPHDEWEPDEEQGAGDGWDLDDLEWPAENEELR